MTQPFVLNKLDLFRTGRVQFVAQDVYDTVKALEDLEKFINLCYTTEGFSAIQSGRVIALRATDANRLSSAFKAAIYLGKYNNMDNVNRFLNNMVKAGHSYEPIRGESVLFLFIGVGKPVYDHMITYSVGRTSRIAGGQRANIPWGFEAPSEMKGDGEDFMTAGLEAVERVARMKKGQDEDIAKQQMQAARSLLPVGYIMPPFLMEFSEEALIKNVFTQRIFEKGAQGATVDVVKDMWNIMKQIDSEKWETLYEYHGPHIGAWKKAMRTLRDKELTFGDLLQMAIEEGHARPSEDDPDKFDMSEIPVYKTLMSTVGKLPPSMWDKQ